MQSASATFSLDYNNPVTNTVTSSVNQFETIVTANYYPGRIISGSGWKPARMQNDLGISSFNSPKEAMVFSTVILTILRYNFAYTQPWFIGGLGRLRTSLEAGKTFGEVPLSLSVVPGNQTYLLFSTPLTSWIFMSL